MFFKNKKSENTFFYFAIFHILCGFSIFSQTAFSAPFMVVFVRPCDFINKSNLNDHGPISPYRGCQPPPRAAASFPGDKRPLHRG